MTWSDAAACKAAPARLFFPPTQESPQRAAVREAKAKAICRTCPVILPCLEAGLGESLGIWGGMTLEERNVVRRLRGLPRLTDKLTRTERRRNARVRARLRGDVALELMSDPSR